MSKATETPIPPAARPLATLLGGQTHEGRLRPITEAILRALQEGRHCIPLNELPGGDDPVGEKDLNALECVGRPGEFKPLIIEYGLLFLHRYWEYEMQVAKRLEELSPKQEQKTSTDAVARLFEGTHPVNSERQRMAVEASASSRLLVISGGPGAGKTSVAARILALSCAGRNPLPQVVLAAPTGKAAARLREATSHGLSQLITNGLVDLPPASVAEICSRASTVHRLLGPRSGSVYFRHDHSNPLPQDIVVVDEVSMMDLPLMAKLLDAIDHRRTQLVLLGDADQLPSVQAGNVMADIIDGGAAQDSFLSHCCHTLNYNFRAQENPALATLVDTCRAGNASAVLEQLDGRSRLLSRIDTPATDKLEALLAPRIDKHFQELLETNDPKAAFTILDQFRILCAMRRGPYGIQSINELVAHRIQPRQGAAIARRVYHGLPIIIARNDYTTRLFNGDTGVILRDGNDKLAAYFPDETAPGSFRKISITRLPSWEPAYALTVHRSQGSQFTDILFLMPDQDSPLLTRQLLYTAVSRASLGVTVAGSEDLIRQTLARGAGRSSGLAYRLGGTPATSG